MIYRYDDDKIITYDVGNKVYIFYFKVTFSKVWKFIAFKSIEDISLIKDSCLLMWIKYLNSKYKFVIQIKICEYKKTYIIDYQKISLSRPKSYLRNSKVSSFQQYKRGTIICVIKLVNHWISY